MSSIIANKILNRINRPDLISVLTNELSGSELNSILLEVFNQKTNTLGAPELLNQYQENRFVKPADLPVLDLKRMEVDILQLFQRYSFEALELSPVSILGSCSVVASANQKKILSALRGTEVLADSTNSIALYASDLKQKNKTAGSSSETPMRFCNIQRHLRTQSISGKGFRPHFKIGCLVTCGTDTGAFDFEKKSLQEHIRVMKALFLEYYKVEEVSFKLLCRKGYSGGENLAQAVNDYVQQQDPDIRITIVDTPEHETNYYKGLQYKVNILMKGKTYEIGDGGFVDWTQQLLQNKKERMLSTGFGFDLMYRIVNGELL
jgi:hypothetical protein